MAKKNVSEENRFAGLSNIEIIFMYYRQTTPIA